MAATTITRLLTDRRDITQLRIDRRDAVDALDEGEVRVAVRRLALTANNVTYAVFGDSMRYWDFFPTGVEGWGAVPAWGYADVLDSRAPGLDAGERLYGYWPIASHAKLVPVRIGALDCRDGAPHRAALPAAYQHYGRCAADAGHAADDEPLLALLRPLYLTAWLLADFLRETAPAGARLVISSASSKTAYGCADALGAAAGLRRIGLTSPHHRGFVEALGCYDAALGYDALEAALPPDTPTLYIDFSGDAALRERVHRHFGAALTHDVVIGATHSLQPPAPYDRSLPGPRPSFFFAPARMAERSEAWGAAELHRRLAAAQREFIAKVKRGGWIEVVETQGFDAARQVLGELIAGRVDPRRGQVVNL
ncbi:MAG TPA: DUF2855 family protein [Methylibium sp.]|uniref:DUF2855 family protein n=1 Tax=Methylibium sp. TaxID=2067992 RepID=UPI002DBBBA69|nr:DUF2855 family protein [Methylibium sp.]HEU4458743.1 DUF2855 family protein [Methylibium sp.]